MRRDGGKRSATEESHSAAEGKRSPGPGKSSVPRSRSLRSQVLTAGRELLGHRSVKTTMIYTHVLNRGGRGVQSPVDRL